MTFDQFTDEIARDGMAWLQVFQAMHFLESNEFVRASPGVIDFVRVIRDLASGGYLTDNAEAALIPLDGLLPKGAKGAKFSRPGRGEGPVKALIRQVLPVVQKKLSPKKPTTLEIWQACASKAKRTMKFYGTGPTPNAGWHIETKGEPDTSYRRFGQSISEVRKALATPPAGE
jgi:hypothetical protein